VAAVIADTLENLGGYLGLHPVLDRALKALGRLAQEPPEADGRHELEGGILYASLSTYPTEEPAAKPFEAHRKYVDVQAVLVGRERLYWTPLAGLVPRRPYSDREDVATFEDPPTGGVGLPLTPGAFVVLFPQDAHKPGCHPAGPEGRGDRAGGGPVRKLVLKVRL
jgi:biofilm protein TabA